MGYMRWLEHPIIVYLIMGVFSSVTAVLFYFAGGELAKVTAEENKFLEVGFEAGGALAGFIIIFLISYKVYGRLQTVIPQKKRVNVKLHLKGAPKAFDHRVEDYTCKYHLFDEEIGDRREFPVQHHWEAGFLTIIVREVGENDMIDVRIEQGDGDQKKVWTCDFFHARSQTKEVRLIEGA